jgi:hypothetical protein
LDNLQAERIESLKAGTIAAFCLFVTYGIATLGNQLILARQFEALTRLEIADGITLLLSGAIAWICGFVFGITYRYVIRSDRNSHLGDGAVLAFGLVRGLAHLEASLNSGAAFWSAVVLGGESLLLFAIARFALDWAIGSSWVKALN